MLRSLNAGVTGMRNHQVRIDVLGNNISNVNTVGFKANRVNFQSQMAQTMRGAAAPQQGRGGTNPIQIGLGMQVGSIDLVQSQGALMTTGKSTDLAISGDGFFILEDRGQQVFTRDGGFDFDREGNFVKVSNGMKIQGWMATLDSTGRPIINTAAPTGSIQIPSSTSLPPQATNQVKVAGNFNSQAPQAAGFVSTVPSNIASFAITVVDSKGVEHKGTLEFGRQADAGGNSVWQAQFVHNDASLGASPVAIGGDLRFDTRGILVANTLGTLNLTPAGADPMTVAMDVGQIGSSSQLTQFAGPVPQPGLFSHTAVMIDQNGFGQGALQGYTIDQSGVLNGIFSNGQTRTLAQVAVATFTNAAGLAQNGENVFSKTANSGDPSFGVALSGSRGAIASGTLEASNVDLAQSFSDLIVTQRGFQSNSRIITTSDEVLQELINLKR